MFVTFEGVDGGGKSTQIELLRHWLEEQGRAVDCFRDPGSTELGEQLRGLLLDRTEIPLDLRAEMLIYMAARAQLVGQRIRPALEAGRTVLCDRFLLSNVAYQGHGGGLDPEVIWNIGRQATGGLMPDLTVVLDVDQGTSASRMRRTPDRIESRGTDFLERVRQGFLLEAQRQPDQIQVVDATLAVEAVRQAVRRAVAPLLQSPP